MKEPFVSESSSRKKENSYGVRPGVRDVERIWEMWIAVPVSVASTSRCRSELCVVNRMGAVEVGILLFAFSLRVGLLTMVG
jgi:hypothetical protein